MKTKQRRRDIYRYSKKDINDLKMLKMEIDFEVFKYISKLDEFKDVDIIFEPDTKIIINGKTKILDTYFVDYRAIMSIIRGTDSKIKRVGEFRCPYKEKYCKSFIENQGKGRKALPDDIVSEIKALSNRYSVRKIAEMLNISHGTVHNYLKS